MDLACTRFSGRTAPPHPGGAPNCADWVMVEGYSHELSAAGSGRRKRRRYLLLVCLSGTGGIHDVPVRPDATRYDADLGEFVLPYETVRTADDPDAMLFDFLQTTYEAAADRAHGIGPRLRTIPERRASSQR